MPKAARNSAMRRGTSQSFPLSGALAILAKSLRGPDAEIVRDAAQELQNADRIWRDLESLGYELTEIERLRDIDLTTHPDEIGKTDLAACTLALEETIHFLRLRAPCETLELLRNGLHELVAGGTPPSMFIPLQQGKGRRLDVPAVVAAKGIIAGMMHVQQSAGMSRKSAAEWAVKYTSPKLAVRISGKPLTPRMVLEWLDRYGGDFAEASAGRKSHLIWSRGEPVSAEKFREITERIAKLFPGRKHR
jgi:hypothetical protein